MKTISSVTFLVTIGMVFSCSEPKSEENSESVSKHENQAVFPHRMPTEKPEIPMNSALERMFNYPAPRVHDNELFSQFKYTRLKGFEYNGRDGTISWRDPSRPILVDGTYYIYYTKRHTKVPPIGVKRVKEVTDEIPSTDWDLSLDFDNPTVFKKTGVWHNPDVYFQQGLRGPGNPEGR